MPGNKKTRQKYCNKKERQHDNYIDKLINSIDNNSIMCKNVEYQGITGKGYGEMDLMCVNSEYLDIYEVKCTAKNFYKAKQQLYRANHYCSQDGLETRLYIYIGVQDKLYCVR